MKLTLDALPGITDSDQFIFKNEFNEAKGTYKKEKDEHLKNKRYDLFVTASNLYCDFLIKSGDYSHAESELKILAARIEEQKQLSDDQIFVDNTIYLYQNFGELYNHIGNYSEAIDYLNDALDIPEGEGSILKYRKGDHFFELGKAFRKLGYYEEALVNFCMAYLLSIEENRLLRYKRAGILNSIGVTYWYKNDPVNARIFVEEGQELLRSLKLDKDHFLWTKSNNDLGLVAWGAACKAHVDERAKLYQSAEKYFTEARKKYEQFFRSGNHRYVANIHGNLGRIYFEKFRDRSNKDRMSLEGQADLARAKKEFALEADIRNQIFAKTNDVLPRHPSLIRGYNFQAELCLEVGDLHEAFNFSNLAIHNGFFRYNYKPDDFKSLRNINLKKQVTSHFYLQRALYIRAKTLFRFYQKSKHSEGRNEYLYLAYQTLKKANKLVLDIRKTYKVNGAILQANAESRPIDELFNEVVHTLINEFDEKALETYDLKPEQLIAEAFDLTERGKAVLLLRAVKHNVDQYGLTEEELERLEEEFAKMGDKAFIKTLYQVIYNYPFSRHPSKKQNGTFPFGDQLKKGKTASGRRAFKEYEDYFAKAYEKAHISVSQTQEELESNSAVVPYFVGEHKMYAFVISQKDVDMVELKFTPPEHFDELTICDMADLREMIKNFNALLSLSNVEFDPYYSDSAPRIIFKYITTAQLLYKTLFQPLEVYLAEIDRIYLIPEDYLSILPFEPLLCKDTTYIDLFKYSDIYEGFRQMDYLLNHYELSYHFSITLLDWHAKEELPDPKLKNFMGFAPKHEGLFQKGDFSLDPLPYAKEELNKAIKMFEKNGFGQEDMQLLLSSEVNQIKAHMHEYKIIHLTGHNHTDKSTHSVGIIFPINEHEEEYLTLQQVYDLKGKKSKRYTHLVILSSCSTGTGAIEKGEGPIAFNRAFLFAGARNIVYTLFHVGDRDAYQLLKLFYQQILNGQYYSSALHEAKKRMMNSKYATPASWAGFVFMGSQIHRFVLPKLEICLERPEDQKLVNSQLIVKDQDGQIIERIGIYDEAKQVVDVDLVKLRHWLGKGAKYSKKINHLLKALAILIAESLSGRVKAYELNKRKKSRSSYQMVLDNKVFAKYKVRINLIGDQLERFTDAELENIVNLITKKD